MTVGKLAKISKQFGQTIHESVTLIHEVGKACQANNEYRDGAQFICGQCEDDDILGIYNGQELDENWPRTTYMNFATLILDKAFKSDWPEQLVELHADVITLIAQRKTEPSRTYLQAAKARDTPFTQILCQHGINKLLLKTWRKQSQMNALSGLRNHDAALSIGTHLNAVVTTTNGFGTDEAWTYMIQTAAAADKTANEMGLASPRSAPTNNVNGRVLNNNRLNFDDATAISHSDSEDNDQDMTNTAAGTNAVKPYNDGWKASMTCFHCRENGHLANECTGRCPVCKGYRGAHKHNCERKPSKGMHRKGGGKGADYRRTDNGRTGYEADNESRWQGQHNKPYTKEKDTDKQRRDERRKEEERRTEKHKHSSRRDSDEERGQKRHKREREDAEDRRTPRPDKQREDRRDKSVDRAKQKEKDEERSSKKNKDSSKNESSRG